MDKPSRSQDESRNNSSSVCIAEGSYVSSCGPFELINQDQHDEKKLRNHEIAGASRSTLGQVFCTGHLYGGAFTHCRNVASSPVDVAHFSKIEGSIQKEYGELHNISSDSFLQILKPENEDIARRLFHLLDTAKKGFVSREETLEYLRKLYTGCFCQKFRLLFDLYDTNGNGVIDEEEFNAVLNSSINKNQLALSTEQTSYLSKNLFDSLDTDKDGVISFNELKEYFDRTPNLLQLFEVSFTRTLAPSRLSNPRTTKEGPKRPQLFPFLRWIYIKHHPREAIWGWIWVFLTTVAFLTGFFLAYYAKQEELGYPCMVLYAGAKAFGKLLTWTSTWSLLFMLRETITYLRDTVLHHYIPFDSTAYAHKINGYLLVFATFGHIVMHFLCYGCLELTQHSASAEADNMSRNRTIGSTIAGRRTNNPAVVVLSANVEMVSGWAAFFAVLVILVGALPSVRRSGNFEIFFYSHLVGYVTYFATLFVHARNCTFWMFASVPVALFISEKVYNLWRTRWKRSCIVKVRKVVQWPSGLTELTLERPLDFRFSPGNYVFIKVPTLTNFEWHPFTISSCPEDRDRIVLHIRSAGDWTRRLYDFFHERIALSTSLSLSAKSSYKMSTKRVMDRRKRLSILNKKRPSMMPQVLRQTDVAVCIRGPYGTPTGVVFECEHAVLVCAGIGVTPFASILQSIVARHHSVVESAVNSHEPIQLGKYVCLRKVDFIWVVRHQRNLEWFVELLQQLDAAQQHEERFHRFLEIHIYVTSATNMTDLQSFALTSALETFYQTHQRDLITGITARARHGRPDWQTLFEAIKEQRRGKVSVFYCGPHPLSRELRQLSHQHNFRFYKETF